MADLTVVCQAETRKPSKAVVIPGQQQGIMEATNHVEKLNIGEFGGTISRTLEGVTNQKSRCGGATCASSRAPQVLYGRVL